jgi:prepilin-type processing-associated H-X9-DG protein
MLFDANGSGENPAGGPELLARRHTGGYVVAFVDGHARSFYGGSPASDELTWDPATR